jgi:hypothetical protein
MRIYWMDANVLIQAKNRHYKFHVHPKFWSFLSAEMEKGTIRVSKMVYDEVSGGDDDLAKWCKQRREKGLCIRPSKAVQDCYGKQVATYVSGGRWKPHHVSEFLRGGDGWVIAHAIESDGIVVTEESDKSHNAKIKIPTVCKALDVECIATHEMLDRLKARLS